MASRDIYSVYRQLILICHEIRQLEPAQCYRTGMKRYDRISLKRFVIYRHGRQRASAAARENYFHLTSTTAHFVSNYG